MTNQESTQHTRLALVALPLDESAAAADRRRINGGWSLNVQERRADRRRAVEVPTTLSCDGRSWKGMTKSLGLGGLSLTIFGDAPALLNQQIVMRCDPSKEGSGSTGVICGIRVSEHGVSGVTAGVIVAVKWSDVGLSPVDRDVLATVLNEEQGPSNSMRFTAELVSPAGDEGLIEARSVQPLDVATADAGRNEESNEARRSMRHRAADGSRRRGAAEAVLGVSTLVASTDTACSVVEGTATDDASTLEVATASSPARAIRTEFSECLRPSGARIVLCYDQAQSGTADDAPVVVLAPGYGESKRDYVPLAYYLAGNGFQVVRYDNVNHVGESDGEATRFRLRDMEEDLEAVLAHVAAQWPDRPVGVVATSLAGRVALKVAGAVSRMNLLVLINGIMDVRHTLQAVHQEDLIGEHMAGVQKGIINILGLTIDADRWLAQAVEGQYADLATTQRDAARLRTPLVLFHAENDAWVDAASRAAVEEAAGPAMRQSFVVPGALHRLQESPRKARAVYRQIAMSCREMLWPAHPVTEVLEPSHREIGMQNRAERARSQAKLSIKKADHVEFWKDYLQNFQTIPNVEDFWSLMDQVYRLMGDCRGGERVLDAGCGNGNFGVLLQLNQAFRQRYASRIGRPLDYVGVDFVPTALAQATTNFAQVHAALRAQFQSARRTFAPMPMRTCRADLESALPFPDHSFDRVVCNLVIGYVRDPLFTLREYLRVLAPNGRLVISNLKPYADLSAIYRNFVDKARTTDQIEEGRRLLDNSGKIKAREGEGVFSFQNQAEFEQLLRAAGAVNPKVYSTFGNQAVVAVVEKGLVDKSLEQLTVAA